MVVFPMAEGEYAFVVYLCEHVQLKREQGFLLGFFPLVVVSSYYRHKREEKRPGLLFHWWVVIRYGFLG